MNSFFKDNLMIILVKEGFEWMIRMNLWRKSTRNKLRRQNIANAKETPTKVTNCPVNSLIKTN
jgi:hypothetical protein